MKILKLHVINYINDVIGVTDDQCEVVGIKLTKKERDELKLEILNESNKIQPDILDNFIRIHFLPIYMQDSNNNNSSSSSSNIIASS